MGSYFLICHTKNMQASFRETPSKSGEICSLQMVKRVAAMLDYDTNAFSNNGLLPRGWHFFMLAGEIRKSALRSDGFPGLGVSLPELGLPRLLLGGRTVHYHSDITIGSLLERTSFIKNIIEKTGGAGPMAIVTIQHELRVVSASSPAITEIQTYILLSGKSSPAKPEKAAPPSFLPKYQQQVKPDETLLFQYSALCFNSHKIHLDKEYARNVEGLPGLVVNGGLTTLLATEFMRNEVGLEIMDITVKHISPLYCGHPLTIYAVPGETNCQLKILDNNLAVAVEIEAGIKLS
jgi:3-methylfumaryl-CoA hydratase